MARSAHLLRAVQVAEAVRAQQVRAVRVARLLPASEQHYMPAAQAAMDSSEVLMILVEAVEVAQVLHLQAVRVIHRQALL
jgi:hypothetical protein